MWSSGYNNVGSKAGWPAEVQRAFEAFARGGGFSITRR